MANGSDSASGMWTAYRDVVTSLWYRAHRGYYQSCSDIPESYCSYSPQYTEVHRGNYSWCSGQPHPACWSSPLSRSRHWSGWYPSTCADRPWSPPCRSGPTPAPGRPHSVYDCRAAAPSLPGNRCLAAHSPRARTAFWRT